MFSRVLSSKTALILCSDNSFIVLALIFVRGKLNLVNSGGLNFRKYTPLNALLLQYAFIYKSHEFYAESLSVEIETIKCSGSASGKENCESKYHLEKILSRTM